MCNAAPSSAAPCQQLGTTSSAVHNAAPSSAAVVVRSKEAGATPPLLAARTCARSNNAEMYDDETIDAALDQGFVKDSCRP